MVTAAARGSGTPVTNGTTWATPANAVDGAVGSNPATYATWTNAVSAATGYIEIGGYNFAATIGASDTINSVTVLVRNLVSNTGRITSLQYQPYDGATPLGTIRTATLTTAAHDDSGTFTVTAAQLRSANFKIRINAVHAANTQSLVLSIDHADVTVDYTPVPPAITQAAYGFYADGTESASTALVAQDTAYSANISGGDVNLLLRARLQSTSAIAVPATDDFKLQWERNASGTWSDLQSLLVNLQPNPSFEVNTTGWSIGLGNGTLARDSTHGGAFGSWAMKVTANATGSFNINSTQGLGGMPALPNTLYQFSCYLWFPSGGASEFSLFVYAWDAAGNVLNSTSSVTLVKDVWARVSGSWTTPANTAFLSFQLLWAPTATGQSIWVDGFQLAQSSTLPAYFDGDSANAAWSGTAHNSPSILSLPAITAGPYNSSNLTDGAATTNRLTGGSGSFTAGEVSEDGLVDDLGWSGNNYTEVLYSITLKQADLANGDTLRFRIVENGSTANMTYTQTPTLIISFGIICDFSDVASYLRDGGGNNILDITSSFETDSNSDGYADGWVTQAVTTSGSSSLDVVDSGSLVTTMSGGHGSFAQQLNVAVASGTRHRVILGPLVRILSTARITVEARCNNPGGATVKGAVGVLLLDSDGVTGLQAPAVTFNQAPGTPILQTYTPALAFMANAYYVRPYVGFDSTAAGTLQFDSVMLHDGTKFTIAYDYVDPANRIQLISGGTAFTRDVSDSAGLTDAVTTVVTHALTLDVSDVTGLVDAGSRASDLVRPDPLGLTDVRVTAVDLARTDTANLTDTVATARDVAYAASDPLGLTDAIAKTVTVDRGDLVPLADTVATAQMVTLNLSDVIGLTDASAKAPTSDRADAIGLTDTFARSTNVLNFVDIAGLQDAVTVTAAGATTLDFSDGAGLTDSAVTSADMIRAFAELIGLTDARSLGADLGRADLASLSDLRVVTADLNRVDTIGPSDALAFVVGTILVVNLADGVGLIDVRSFDLLAGRSDLVGLSDLRSVGAGLERSNLLGLTDYAGTDFPAGGGLGWPKVWTGSAWVVKPAKIWTGTAWAQKPMKVWTGSAWKTLT